MIWGGADVIIAKIKCIELPIRYWREVVKQRILVLFSILQEKLFVSLLDKLFEKALWFFFFFFFDDYFFLLKPRNNIKQNEEAKPQRNVVRYFKKYEYIVGPSEDLQNKGVWPQLSLPLQAELYWRIPEVLKADKFSGLLESLTKTSRSASRSLTISRNDLSILQNLFPSFPFILVWKPIARSRF